VSSVTIALLNIFIWPVAHVSVSWWALRLDSTKFHSEDFLYRERFWEFGGALYERLFLIKKWKRLLPDGAAMLGVEVSRNINSLLTPTGQQKLFNETMRSELAHWMTMIIGLLLSVFNSFEVWLVMLAYAIVANVPCILAQRYNRIKLGKILTKKKRPQNNLMF